MADRTSSRESASQRDLLDERSFNERASRPQRKVPWDGKLLAAFEFFGAALSFYFSAIFLTGSAELTDEPPSVVRIVFGTVQLHSQFSRGIASIAYGCLGGITAYGLLKGFSFGWWGLLMLDLDAIPRCVAGARVGYAPVRAWTWLGVSIGILVWLFYRRRVYRPFGGRWDRGFRGDGPVTGGE